MLSESLKAVLAVLEGIPTLPVFAEQLMLTIQSDDFTAKDLEKLIKQDPAVATRLLKVANSAFFGHAGQVKTLERAVVILGTLYVQALALSMTIIDNLSYGREVGHVPWKEYWLHSFACGWVCQRLVEKGVYADAREAAFLCGLLHDIGKPVLWIYESKAYQTVMQKIREEKIETHEAENWILGGNHAEVGGELAQCWDLPEEIREAIQDHHEILPCSPAARLVQVADLIVHATWFSTHLRSRFSALSLAGDTLEEVDHGVLVQVIRELIRRDDDIQDLVRLLRLQPD